MSPAQPSFTVVVPTRRRSEVLERCLRSLAELDYPDFRVLIVDNGPDEATRAVAERWRAQYVVEPVAGLDRARNTGAREVTTELLAFTDDDALVDRGWLAALAAEFERSPACMVTGRVLPLDPAGEGAALYERLGAFGVGEERLEVTRETPGWFSLANFGGLGCGANLAFRRELFERWDGFDERLGPGGFLTNEEQHAMFRLLAQGETIVYTPAAIVRHPVPGTPAELRRRREHVLRGTTGYMTLLWVEHPEYRRELREHLRAARRRKASGPRVEAVPLHGEATKRLEGLWTYFRRVWRRPRSRAAKA